MNASPHLREPVDEWHGRPVDAWRALWGVPALHVFRTVDSTNDVARELAEAGAPEGTTVLTDGQTRGRGRRGRVWESHAGKSMILSMVVRPPTLGAERILSLRLGLATARAIEAVTPLAVGIKWPNDLLVEGRKVGGMLCEGVVEGEEALFVIAGTGVNVHQDDDAWTGPLAGRATSLGARSPEPVAVDELAGEVIARWLDVLGRPGDTLTADELAAFADRHVMAGRPVTLDGEEAGTVVGLAPDGALEVRRSDGVHRLISGTLRAVDTEPGDTE